ncbi:hypothetical protein AOQ84DRAFT_426325, partial [Glonium stellatum]
LAKYLGNFIDKLSDWPLIYHCYSGNRRLRRLKAHKKYGMRKISRSIIRIGPNTLDFDTATVLTAIHRDRNANVKKGDWYKTIDASAGAYSIQSVIDKHEHTFRRRVLSPAFSESALRDQEQSVD